MFRRAHSYRSLGWRHLGQGPVCFPTFLKGSILLTYLTPLWNCSISMRPPPPRSVHCPYDMTQYFSSTHDWLVEESIEDSISAAISDHLQRSHLTQQWVPPPLCSAERLDRLSKQFIKNIRHPPDTTIHTNDSHWSSAVGSQEGRMSIESILQNNSLRIKVEYGLVEQDRTEYYVLTSDPILFFQ